MKLSTPRALTAALASLAIVAGVLPAATALAAPPNDPKVFAGTITPQGAANTNTAVAVTVTNSSHTQAGGVPPVIMYLTGPPAQPGNDPATNAAYLPQKVIATGVTVTGSTITGTFNFVSASQPAGPGLWDLTICYATAATDGSCSAGEPVANQEFGNDIFTVFAPTPDITTLSPASRAAGGTLLETVQGLNIGRGATLDVLRDGAPITGFTFTSYSYSAAQTVTANLAIDAGVVPRTYDLRFTNTDGKSDVIPNGLTVTPAITLAVTPINPSGATRGVVNYPFTVTGTAFQQGANVYAQDPALTGTDAAKGAGVAFSIASITPTTITGTLSITDTATTTVARNLVVVNPDASRASSAGAFTLFPAPTVGTPSPASRGRGAKSDITVNGTNFRLVGATGVPLVDFGADITHGAVEYVSSTALLVRAVSIGQAAAIGGRAIRVSNVDGAYVSSSSTAFTVNAGPVITTVAPSHGARGGPVTLSIAGSGFGTTANDLTVSIVDPATNVAVCTSAPVTGTSSGNQVTATCNLPGTLATGQYAVRVDKLSDGGSGSCANVCFTVDAFGVNSVSTPPGGLGNNEPNAVPITVTGSSMPSDGRISFRHNPSLFDQPDLTPVACPATANCNVSTDGTTVTQYFVFNNVAPGKYDVIVTGTVTGNQVSGQCSCQINVFSAGSPTVTTVVPSSFVQGATEKVVTVTGTNLFKGARAVISGGDSKITVVPGSEVVAADHLSMTFKVNVDGAAATPGTNVVKIVDSSSPPASSGTTPLVVTKRPTITTIAPTTIGRGGVTPTDGFTIKGQNFVLDATDPNKSTKVSFCTGVTATGLKIVKGASPADDTATMTLAIAGDAPLGSCPVTVTNPDTGAGTAPLTITEAPVTTRLSPSGLAKGRSAVDVVLSGTGYVTGATVAFLKAGVVDPKITVNSVTFGSSGQITANVTTAADAATGVRSVKVTNPDLGSFTCVDCFAIAVVPGAPVSVKPRVGDGRIQVIWTKPLSDGGAAISSYVVTVSPGGRQIPVASGTATSVMVNALTNGTAYTFSVKASNVVGSGPATVSDAQKPAPVTRLVSIKPEQIVNSATGLGLGGIAGKVSNKQFDVPFANVPADATGAVVSIAVNAASATTYVKAYGTGTPSSGAVLYGLPGINHTGTSFITFGAAKALHVSVVGGPANIVVNHVAWLERLDQDGAAASSVGGHFVPANKVLVNYRMSSAGPLPAVNPGFYYDFGTSLPDVDAVALQISTSDSRSSGTVTAYSPDDGQVATSHAFTRSRASTTFVIARVSKVETPSTTDPAGTMTNRLLLKVGGQTGLLVTMVGYWGKDNTAFPGHSMTLAQTRILATPTARPGEITVKVPASVPGTVTGVLIAVTAFDGTGSTVVRAYADGSGVTIPSAYTNSYTAGDKASNLAIVAIGTNRYIKLKVYGASTKLYVEVLGYIN